MTNADWPPPRVPLALPRETRSISRQGPAQSGARFGAIFLFSLLSGGCGEGGPVDDPTPLYGEVPIQYPLDLWDADVEGETLLRVRVSETGGVDSVEVLEASGYPAFDSAAVRGARQLRYDPARRNGKRISVWAKVPVHFIKGSQSDRSSGI